jgi:hypothetical protein
MRIDSLTKADAGCYIGRPLENHAQLRAWCAEHGIACDAHPHITLCHSTVSVRAETRDDTRGEHSVRWGHTIYPEQFTHIAPLGSKGAVVLHVRDDQLGARYAALQKAGAVSSYPDETYKPHITLTYDGASVQWQRVPLPDFALRFGPERHGPIGGDVFAKQIATLMQNDRTPEAQAMIVKQLTIAAQLEQRTPHIIAALRRGMGPGEVRKADAQQLAMGWASVVSDAQGRIVVDRQGDVIRMADITKAAHDYMRTDRTGGIVHMQLPNAAGVMEPVRVGQVIEGLIVTPVVKAVLGLPADTPHGFAITMHVSHASAWKATEAGTFKMFSIGGRATRRAVSLPREMVAP